jgi:hypothetical protein
MNRLRSARPTRSQLPAAAWPLALVLLASATGCFRATGIQRSILAAEEIPAVGGDRPAGLKAASGPGDYYLGNDFVELAMDGTPFGERDAIAGAASGGSVVDVGYIQLDTSFRRVSMPSDSLDRLTPVVNQDPDLQLVFDRFVPSSANDVATLTATGGLYDPNHKLSGASWDGQHRVAGVGVTHKVELARQGRYFTLETTVTNTGSATLPIRNIADALVQRGGGFRAVIPAQQDANGATLSGWGVQIPGSSFANPLGTSVQAPMVGFMAAEPGAATEDSHATLGLLPVDADKFMVASDPQPALTESRPKFPERVVVGSLPVSGLAAGQSLVHRRRLYLVGGASISNNLPNQTTGLMNEMQSDRASLRNIDQGFVLYRTFGTASRSGPIQAEVRFERNLGTTAVPNWQLERVEWQEPNENAYGGITGVASPDTTGVLLPTGTYRVIARNKFQETTLTMVANVANQDRPNLVLPLVVEKDKQFSINEYIAPERHALLGVDGSMRGNVYSAHYFFTVGKDQAQGHLQPARFTFVGLNGAPDPDLQRARSLGAVFDAVTKAKVGVAGNTGAYRFRAGNQVFGAAFQDFVPEPIFFRPGRYVGYATRGPLSVLDPISITAFDGQSEVSHGLLVFPAALPSGWTSFDLPGASQATTGGLLPAEKLASALAEQVQVVAHTETDLNPDADALYQDFRVEFGSGSETEASRSAIGLEPFVVGARSSELAAHGAVTALFVPKATKDARAGARQPRGWSLADFLSQAEGAFHVVQRPRGPKGLFTLRGFNPAVALGSGVNAWWTATGTVSNGRTNGSFEALELLRADGFDPASPAAWFAEFKQVRADWFAILNQQTPAAFTKGLGLSAARFSLDTPVGQARTWLKTGTAALKQDDLASVLTALKAGAAVASTGPLLDASIGSAGPGGLVAGPVANVTVNITLTAGDWVPVDELRIIVNGQVVQTLSVAGTLSTADGRTRTGSVAVSLPAGKDAWIVVEAGVALNTTGAYAAGTPWSKVSKGMYPIAVTNPIFVDANGGGYAAPGI